MGAAAPAYPPAPLNDAGPNLPIPVRPHPSVNSRPIPAYRPAPLNDAAPILYIRRPVGLIAGSPIPCRRRPIPFIRRPIQDERMAAETPAPPDAARCR